jgi:type II secretory pathway pseudopilin PulG
MLRRRPPPSPDPTSNRFLGSDGFSVLELLVIAAIFAVVVAIGVPTLHRTSAKAVLAGNVYALASLVEEEMLQGWDNAYHQTGEGSPDRYLSNRLEYLLGLAQGAARYTNPQADGSRDDVVLNSRAIPAGPSSASPAVFITDNPACDYEVFDAQPYDTSRRFLAGSMVVQFSTAYQSVEVFYVDKDGKKSADVTRFPTG